MYNSKGIKLAYTMYIIHKLCRCFKLELLAELFTYFMNFII